MPQEKIYELKQDICTPAYYIRAGEKASLSKWKERLGDFNLNWIKEWLIDLSLIENEKHHENLESLINEVFHKYNLHSSAYQDAAKEIAQRWLKQNLFKEGIPKHLLIPRYRVIASFPFKIISYIFKVGDIITDNGITCPIDQNNDPVTACNWDDYPHLFKKLQWWEYRTPEEFTPIN